MTDQNVLGAAAVLLLSACGADEVRVGAAPDGPSSALYAVAAAELGEVPATYLLTVPSLDASVVPDYGSAVVLDSFAALYGRPGSSTVFIGSGDEPIITRWQVGPDGFQPGAQVSFANLGVATAGTFPSYVPVLSDEKAYFFDPASLQAVIWRPRDMSVLGSIELDIEARGGLTPSLGDGVVVRGEQLLVHVSWADADGLRTSDVSRVLVIDTRSDRVVERHDDARITDNYVASLAPDQTLFLSPYPAQPLVRRVFGEAFGSRGSVLRVIPDGTRIDDGYELDLETLTGGLPAGQLQVLDNDTAFIRVRDQPDSVTPDNWLEQGFAPAYRWWRWSIGSAMAEPADNQAPGVPGGIVYGIDGRTYATTSSEDFTSSTLVELSPSGELRPGLTVRGYPYGVLRVR